MQSVCAHTLLHPQIRGGLAWDHPQRRLYLQGPLGHVCTHFWLSPQLLARAAAQHPAAHRTAPAAEPGLAQNVSNAGDETPRAILTPAGAECRPIHSGLRSQSGSRGCTGGLPSSLGSPVSNSQQ